MKRSCVYCGRIHPKEYICPHKPVRKKTKSHIARFRSSAAWQHKREAVALRDLYLCRVCLDNGVYTGNIQVHHITPLVTDFSVRLDEDNLISLCPVHHEQAEAGNISVLYLRQLASSDLSISPPGSDSNTDSDI